MYEELKECSSVPRVRVWAFPADWESKRRDHDNEAIGI
jgi:hypothetical protein